MLRLLLFLVVLCCSLAEVVCADEPGTPNVRIGIENTYKNGLWTPITVEFIYEAPPNVKMLLWCSDSDGIPITYRYEVGGKKSVTVLAKLGRKDEPIHLSLDYGEFTTTPRSFPVPPPVNAERPIYLIFGNEDIGLQGAIAELMLREERRPLLVKVNSFGDLPTEWFGYEAVEMVVLTTTEPQIFEGLTKESPQIQALNNWLKLGGKMLLCAGKEAGQFLDDENGFLHIFLPGKYDGMTEIRGGSPFERFVNSNRQITMNGTEEAPFMKMPRLTETTGITFMKDGDLPLVLRTAHGLGTIIYFGGDLSERPLKNWRDRMTLVRSIMQWDAGLRPAGRAANTGGTMLQLGYNDIMGQIRSALDQFEGIHIVPFSVILVILTAYWLVIGLFDWFLVHKVFKRPILTWFTFPLWIVLFSYLSFFLAMRGLPEKIYNNLTIIDVDYETGVCRTSFWEGVYGRVFWEKRQLRSEMTGYYSWNGLPGNGLGGMAPKTVTPSVWQAGYEQSAYNQIDHVPLHERSTKSFFGQYEECNDYRSLSCRLSDDEGIPVGVIDIFDDSQISLKNCILVYGRWVIELGEIQPGQSITITKTTPRRDWRDLLIPPKSLENTTLRSMASYNPQSADLEYIVRVMSLHRALGGYEATGLHHAYMPSLDMSGLLTADRAILLGTIKTDGFLPLPGAYRWSRCNEFFRQSLPIELTKSSPRLRGERQQESGTGALDVQVKPTFISVPSPR